MTTNSEAKEKRAAWREANRERLRAYDRARYPERAKAYQKRAAEWRRNNPDAAREIQRRWREANPDKVRALGRARYAAGKGTQRAALGYPPARFKEKFVQQGECCAICGTRDTKKWTLDHDHGTGLPRGILCNPCNLAIGLLKDEARVARAAAAYLDAHAQLHALLG